MKYCAAGAFILQGAVRGDEVAEWLGLRAAGAGHLLKKEW